MMRSLVWLGAVAIIVMASGAVAGQNPRRPGPVDITLVPQQVLSRTARNPSAIVDRIFSFDANGDDRIARDELPERMQGLVSRGDKNDDGFLTADEVVVLVDTPSTVPRTSLVVRNTATLADVIADLKLPASTHNRALAIVKGPRNVHDPASVDLNAEMRAILDDEDYDNFIAAVSRLRRSPRARVISGDVGGVVGGVPIQIR